MTFTYLTGLIQSVTTSVSFDKHENEMNQQQVEFTGLFIYTQSNFEYFKVEIQPKLLISQSKFSGSQKIYFEKLVV